MGTYYCGCYCYQVCSCDSVCAEHVAPCPTNDNNYTLPDPDAGDLVRSDHINQLITAIEGDLADTNRRSKYWNPNTPNLTPVSSGQIIQDEHIEEIMKVLEDIGGNYGYTDWYGNYRALNYLANRNWISDGELIDDYDIDNLRNGVRSMLEDCVCNNNNCNCNGVCNCNSQCNCVAYHKGHNEPCSGFKPWCFAPWCCNYGPGDQCIIY